MTSSRKRRKPYRWLTASSILILVAAYVAACLLLPLRALAAKQPDVTLTITTPDSNLPWPSYGQEAVGLANGTIVYTHGQQTPVPIASVAKLITALAVLSKYPLSPEQQGPMITIDTTDYGYYTTYIAEQGSVVPVYLGEQLSEYDMLQAMLVPSGNNIADALARWAFGSLSNYDSFANSFVQKLGLKNTHVGVDASGYSPATTSTASDLIHIGSLVMANPVLAQIVGQKNVIVPNVGPEANYNTLIGTDGIIGIKTGNSNQAGGVFLAAAKTTVNGQSTMVITAIMGTPALNQALADTVPLVTAITHDFTQAILINKGEILGYYQEPWGGTVSVEAASNLFTYVLEGEAVKAVLHINKLSPRAILGTDVGTVTAQSTQFASAQSVPVITQNTTSRPTWTWRLLHPLDIL